MSAMLAIGTAFSIYQGIQSGKEAKEASGQAREAYLANQAVAGELKERQRRLVDQPLEARMAELQSKALTPGAKLAEDRFQSDVARINRGIMEQAPETGEGVTGSRLLSTQFRQASGLANIELQDQMEKARELPAYMQMAQQTPAWAGIATGANTQMGNYEAGMAGTARENEESAYGAAARGMAALAGKYANWEGDGGGGTPPAPQGGPAAQTSAPRGTFDPITGQMVY